MLPLQVFLALQTQWRYSGMGGATGLDYGALPAVFELLAVKKKQRGEVFESLRIMEGAALTSWSEQRASRQA